MSNRIGKQFLAAERLGIDPDVRDAMITLLGKLERGEIPHEDIEPHRVGLDLYATYPPETFNLLAWRCGTAACLGGWVEHILGRRIPDTTEYTDLDNLFYPEDLDQEYRNPDEKAAARALRNFLTTGRARWPEAVRPPA